MTKRIKNVTLEDSHIAYVLQVKKDEELSSFSATLDMMISFYQKQQEITESEKFDLFFKEFDRRYKAKLFDPIRLRTGYTEKNILVALELLNALAARLSLSHTSTKYAPTLCLTQARDEVQKNIEANKQRKDNKTGRKTRKQTKRDTFDDSELMDIDFEFLDLTE